MKRIFRYLKGTEFLGLWYPKDFTMSLLGYTDADYAGFLVDRKSTSGMAQFHGPCLVLWGSRKQNSVALSTTEAEYVAAAACCSQLLWLKQQLSDFGMDFNFVKILCILYIKGHKRLFSAYLGRKKAKNEIISLDF